MCNFLRFAAYCSMDAKRNMAKEPQPREGEATQMEGLGLGRVIARAQGRDADALGEIYRRYARRVGSGRCPGCHGCERHHTDWSPNLAYVAGGVSGCDL